MTPERLLVVKNLLKHPTGVGPEWTKNLINELLQSVYTLNKEVKDLTEENNKHG